MNLNDIKSNVRKVVVADLQPPLNKRVARLVAAGALGSLASLAVCGQFGIGLTSWAQAFSSHIHDQMPPWQCSVVCGVLFAVFPVTILRLITSPMLFHVLFSKYFAQVAMIFGTIGAFIAVLGHHGNSLELFALWSIAAIGTTWCAARLISALVPRFQFPLLMPEGLK